MLNADERLVVDYLKSSPNAWFSAREVSRRAADKERWEENGRWALPVLNRLANRGLVETDGAGHYRVLLEKLEAASKPPPQAPGPGGAASP